MKKVLLFICCILIIFTMTACMVHPKVTSVEKSDYQWAIDLEESSNEGLNNYHGSEELNTARAAAKRAEKVWFGVYGRRTIIGERPYRVSYDKSNGIWFVEGTLRWGPFPSWLIPMKGGTAYIVMQQEDGKILAIGHGE